MLLFVSIIILLIAFNIGSSALLKYLTNHGAVSGCICLVIIASIAIHLCGTLSLLTIALQDGILFSFNKFVNGAFISILRLLLPETNIEILRQASQDLNVSMFFTSLFSIGFVVASLGLIRQSSNLNPYYLNDYFNIPLYINALLFLLVTCIYLQTIKLRTLLCVTLIVMTACCIFAPVYIYVFHTPPLIAYNMASIISRKIKKAYEKSPTAKCPSVQTHELANACSLNRHSDKIANYSSIIDDILLWNKTLAVESKSTPLVKQARHLMTAITFVINKKGMLQILKEDERLVPFILGYFSLYPSSNVDYRLHGAFFHFILTECNPLISSKPDSPQTEVLNSFIAGTILARFKRAFDEAYAICAAQQRDFEEVLTREIHTWYIDCLSILGIKEANSPVADYEADPGKPFLDEPVFSDVNLLCGMVAYAASYLDDTKQVSTLLKDYRSEKVFEKHVKTLKNRWPISFTLMRYGQSSIHRTENPATKIIDAFDELNLSTETKQSGGDYDAESLPE